MQIQVQNRPIFTYRLKYKGNQYSPIDTRIKRAIFNYTLKYIPYQYVRKDLR